MLHPPAPWMLAQTVPSVEPRTVGGAPAPAAAPGAAPAAPGASPVPTAGGGLGNTGGSTTIPSTQVGSQPVDAKPAPNILQTLGGIAPIILMLGVLYFVMIRGQKKEEKRKKSLIAELKKGDRVMTIGGLVARVVSIDGEEVVLKIDESANVKATYRKSAIQEVLVGDEKK